MISRNNKVGAWLHVPRPLTRPALRLFAFPYAGATGSAYHAWAQMLPSGIELCGIQMPGRHARIHEPSCTRLEPLVDALVSVLVECADAPFVCYGHSMGAVLAFALTRELQARAYPLPRHLVVSGRSAPHLMPPRSGLHLLPDAEFIEQLRLFNGMPRQLLDDPEIMQLVLPAMRADFGLLAGIAPVAPAPMPVPVSAWGGRTDTDAPEAAIRAWEQHTSEKFEVRMFDGGHFFINELRGEVLAALSEICMRAAAGEIHTGARLDRYDTNERY
jgi:medium-chain acyl-[acyl-carrier-protein] hydrolase